MVTHSSQAGGCKSADIFGRGVRGSIWRGQCGWVSPTCPGLPAPTRPFPLFAFVFLIALGFDDNMFLMTRVCELPNYLVLSHLP